MAKNNYARVNTPVGVAVYPHLTEPDYKFDADGVFKTNLAVAADEAVDLVGRLEEIRDAAHAEWLDDAKDAKVRAARKKWTIAEVAEVELDDDGTESGRLIFKAKMKHNVKPKNGKPFKQSPILVDSANNKVVPGGLKLWGGSRVRLNCSVIPYAMDSSKTFGVSLRLYAVQIIELSAGGGGSPFDDYEGGETIASGPASKPDADDEAPFDNDGDDY